MRKLTGNLKRGTVSFSVGQTNYLMIKGIIMD